MRRSFYHYLMTLRGPDRDAIEKLATNVFLDTDFPKHAEDYETLSRYLETHVDYLDNMDLFDQLFSDYAENNK